MFENVVTALGRKMTILDSDFVGHEVAYRPLWADHFKNSELIHTWSKKYNFKCPHCLSHLSLCGKKFEKFQQWHEGTLLILTAMGSFTLN